jgi:hypothetical protein
MRRIVATAVAGIAASLTMAGMAAASTGTTQISPEEAGYSVTGTQFKDVSASVYLRNPEQYASVIGGYGHSVQLWSPSQVVVLGVSDTTAAGSAASGFSPAVAVFDRSTQAWWLPAATARSLPNGAPRAVPASPPRQGAASRRAPR